MNIEKFAGLDTNILLLKLVADTDWSLLRSFKRVQTFTEEDVFALQGLLASYAGFISTPHVMSETNNFLDQAPLYRRLDLIEAFRLFVRGSDEWYEAARDVISRDQFPALGLTDTGLLSISRKITVVTADWRLAGQIVAAGGMVINFNHVRTGLV